MKKYILFLISLTILYSCSSVQIYSDGELKKKTGLKYYPVKPYLLVELKSNKDMTIKTSIIYLPDLLSPQYLKVTPGIGANELKMSFANGSLTSYGLTSESEIPETISSLATLINKTADVAKQFAGEMPVKQPSGDENFLLYEIDIKAEGTVLRKVIIE